ncbi:Tat pathway signal protein [Teichococcus vastitatis]|uniref:Tat pathway signal protein n=1 Tax=Teichococcus vastitatis TaxID=2307076 RepID=A0ABS9W252_9PROT|nr:Tat pathway signal protein [Pseudoroseomonas vastitatis]MCI0753374.1 Tat pathway signal protein [Pseudoroseomonas vastitatis]
MLVRQILLATATATGLLLLAPFARAQTATPIGLELNRLEARQEGCRVWLVLRNPGEEAVDPLRLDLLVFGKDGVVSRRLALDVGPLPAEKTMARIFDLNGQNCDGIGTVLLNDLLACGASAEARAGCLSRITLGSRVEGVPFEK